MDKYIRTPQLPETQFTSCDSTELKLQLGSNSAQVREQALDSLVDCVSKHGVGAYFGDAGTMNDSMV